MLVETDSLVLIEALTLLLMLAEVLAEVEASPEPLLVLALIEAEADWLADTDAEVL